MWFKEVEIIDLGLVEVLVNLCSLVVRKFYLGSAGFLVLVVFGEGQVVFCQDCGFEIFRLVILGS